MTKLRDFLVAVTNRYHEKGGDVIDAVDDVLIGWGYTIITNEQYVELCAEKTPQNLCPYCDHPLDKPGVDYDQDGYSRATWICTGCESTIVCTRYPPEK